MLHWTSNPRHLLDNGGHKTPQVPISTTPTKPCKIALVFITLVPSTRKSQQAGVFVDCCTKMYGRVYQHA